MPLLDARLVNGLTPVRVKVPAVVYKAQPTVLVIAKTEII